MMDFFDDDWRSQTTYPTDFVYKIARAEAEIDGFWQLRRAVFCEEQGIFHESDEDERDRSMIPIICVSMVMGMEDSVGGVVRIHEHEPRVWWGSRLAVHSIFRRRQRLSRSVLVRNHQPDDCARSIGAGLIYKAVSTARALGCATFYAHVQQQNAAFFETLHWKSLGPVRLHDRPHVHMEADLNFYRPATHDLAPAQVA
jgi:hypothetical protein